MKQDKWTQQLHDALTEHQTAAPEGLWSDIEAALGAQPQPRKARFVAMRRWIAAASVALFAVAGSYWWLTADHQSESNTAPQQAVSDNTHAHHSTSPTPQDTSPTTHATLHTTHDTRNISHSTLDIPQNDSLALATNEEQPQQQPSQQQQQPQQQPTPQEQHTNQATELPAQQWMAELTDSPNAEHKTALSVGLYASNGLVDQTGGNNVVMDESMENNFAMALTASERRSAPRMYLSGYEERQHHYLPLSVGISLGYQLSPRLAVTSGFVYTRMRSDFTQLMNTQAISQRQTLHYVGVPLGLSCRLYQQGSFNVYLTAGGEVDWNIKTRMETEGVVQPLQHDRTQWSLRGSLGVAYDVIPQLSLYAEPGLSHYFDNGSSTQNYWKDKPTSVNLQFGVRLNLTK